jgi:hypothetical protein
MSKLSLSLCALLGFVAFGCQRSEECEKSRIALAKTWEEVRNSASGLKYEKGEREGEATSNPDRLKRWEKVETRAGLVQSAFISQQATWDSADDARTEIAETVQRAEDTGMLVDGFNTLLKQANDQYETYRGSCR